LDPSVSFGDDLAARNIQRGRDHGIPSYNKLRLSCNLANIENMENKPDEINQANWDKIVAIYENVEDIDAYPGGFVGPTFACIIAKQFKALMSGDRYFFTHPSEGDNAERGLKEKSRNEIRNRKLSDIICNHTAQIATQQYQQMYAMKTVDEENPLVNCGKRTPLDFSIIAGDFFSEEIVQCSNYNWLDDPKRSSSYDTTEYFCDKDHSTANTGDWKGPGWYRFSNGGKLREGFPGERHCNTYRTGYLDGHHPTETYKKERGTVYFGINANKWIWKVYIDIINCGNYYIYNLVDMPYHKCGDADNLGLNARYCSDVSAS